MQSGPLQEHDGLGVGDLARADLVEGLVDVELEDLDVLAVVREPAAALVRSAGVYGAA